MLYIREADSGGPVRNNLFLVAIYGFIFVVSAHSFGNTPADFTLAGKCSVALAGVEGNEGSGYFFIGGVEIPQDALSFEEEISLKPGGSQMVSFMSAQETKLLVSLNREGHYHAPEDPDKILGHTYLLTLAVVFDHETSWPQDRFRFGFGNNPSRTIKFKVGVDGKVKYDYYSFEKMTEGNVEGLNYEYEHADNLGTISLQVVITQNYSMQAKVGGDRFIPLPQSEADQEFQAANRILITFNPEIRLEEPKP